MRGDNPLLKIDSHLARFGVIVWISILLGTIIPAIVAARHHVFYKQDIEKQIVSRKVQPAADIQSQKDELEKRLEVISAAISDKLTTAKDKDEIKSLISLRSELQDQLSQLNEKIVVAPFFLNDLMVGWSAMYIALATLIFILLPKTNGRSSLGSWKVALAVGAIYPIYQGPVWLRNFVLTNEQRRVYSFANHDIGPASFWMQELNTLIWMMMLAYLWHRWFVIYKRRSSELAQSADSPPDMKGITTLSDTFLHWQLSSVVLASGFIVFTGIFWGLVIVNKDRRYLVPAVVVHVLWALSWMLATLPLFATWQDFNRKKMRALLASSRGEAEGEKASAETEALEKLTPVTLWNGFGSAATAVLSFAFPIVHALLK